MSDADDPIAIDLVPYADALGGAREFLRIWAKEGGRLNCFVNPRALGPDPALFGAALHDAMTHAAAAWAKAVGISEDEARQRIREGFDQQDTGPATELPPPLVVGRKED